MEIDLLMLMLRLTMPCLFPLSMHAKVRSNYIQAPENVGYRVCAVRKRDKEEEENNKRNKSTEYTNNARETNSAFVQINAIHSLRVGSVLLIRPFFWFPV
jgi:hypothetical protein